jgi:hypothetical protein
MRFVNTFVVLAVFALPALSQDERRRPPPVPVPPPDMPGPAKPPPREELARMADEHARRAEELREAEARIAELGASGKTDEAEAMKRRTEELRRVIEDLTVRRAELEARLAQSPGGDPMGPPPIGPGRGPASKADIARAKEWAKANDPALFEEVTRLESERPEEATRRWTRLAHEVRDLNWMKDHDPERYDSRLKIRKLEGKSEDLADRARRSEGQEKEEAKRELKEVLGQLFDLREADKQWELKRLEDELSRLKESFDKRRAAKDKIVERRLEEMTGEAGDFDWDGGPGGEGRPPDKVR